MYEIIMVVESQIVTSAIFVTGPAKTGIPAQITYL